MFKDTLAVRRAPSTRWKLHGRCRVPRPRQSTGWPETARSRKSISSLNYESDPPLMNTHSVRDVCVLGCGCCG
eukprot:3418150-Prymnesium_polylepis.1